jgi:hypothetical protein
LIKLSDLDVGGCIKKIYEDKHVSLGVADERCGQVKFGAKSAKIILSF